MRPARRLVRVALLATAATAAIWSGAAAARAGAGEIEVYGVGRDSVDVEAGRPFRVRLASNPTTGYAWRQVGRDSAGILEIFDERYVAPRLPLIGEGGVQEFDLVARAPGRTRLRFAYGRAWEGARPWREAFFDVLVRARPVEAEAPPRPVEADTPVPLLAPRIAASAARAAGAWIARFPEEAIQPTQEVEVLFRPDGTFDWTLRTLTDGRAVREKGTWRLRAGRIELRLLRAGGGVERFALLFEDEHTLTAADEGPLRWGHEGRRLRRR